MSAVCPQESKTLVQLNKSDWFKGAYLNTYIINLCLHQFKDVM